MQIRNKSEFVVALAQHSKGGILNMPVDTLDIRCVDGALRFYDINHLSGDGHNFFDGACVDPYNLSWSCFYNGERAMLACACGFADDAGFVSQYCYCMKGDVYWIIDTGDLGGVFLFRYKYEDYRQKVKEAIQNLYNCCCAGSKIACKVGEETDRYPALSALKELPQMFSSKFNVEDAYAKETSILRKLFVKYGHDSDYTAFHNMMFPSFAIRNKDEEPALYLLMGLPASGKTTFCQNRWRSMNPISLDAVRTRANEQLLIDDAFSQHVSLTIDNTNVTRAERAKYIVQAKEHGYKVEGYYFQSVIADCLERNAGRQGTTHVPDVAILSKSKQMELPSYGEGFDRLWYVSLSNGGEFDVQQWKEEE